MQLLILNGPNLNLLGKREPGIYGKQSFDAYYEELIRLYPTLELEYMQSNIEGELVNALHTYGFTADGIILNAGAYTHTSLAIADAILAIETPVIEVHISNVYAREPIRHVSLLAPKCRGIITGFGLLSYRLAIESLLLPSLS